MFNIYLNFREAIWRVLAATGESLPLAAMKSGRKKPPKDVARILGDRPNLQFTQSLINLTISTASLTLVVTNTGQVNDSTLVVDNTKFYYLCCSLISFSR